MVNFAFNTVERVRVVCHDRNMRASSRIYMVVLDTAFSFTASLPTDLAFSSIQR